MSSRGGRDCRRVSRPLRSCGAPCRFRWGRDASSCSGQAIRYPAPSSTREARAGRFAPRRGVLIATGSYGNAPYAAELEGLPEIFEASPPVLDGDALALVEPTGAARVRSGQAFTIFGFESPDEHHPGTDVPLHRELSRALGLPHAIVVNREGRRFGDESFYGFLLRAVKVLDDATGRFPNYPCYLVGDNRYRTRYRLGDAEEWPANLAQAPRLDELAGVLGIDPDGLVAQIAAFNEQAERGDDPEFDRGTLPYSRLRAGDPNQEPNPNLGSLREPPFLGASPQAAGDRDLLNRPADQQRGAGVARGPLRRPGVVRHGQRRRLRRAAPLRRRSRQRTSHHLRLPRRRPRGIIPSPALSADPRTITSRRVRRLRNQPPIP